LASNGAGAVAPTPRAAALRGWLYGVGVLGFGTFWLAQTIWINLLLVSLAGPMWHAAWGWAARRVLPTARSWSPPLLWTAREIDRLHWPLGGYRGWRWGTRSRPARCLWRRTWAAR
jgi:apolipoprotein N-acyltransferase